MNADRDRSEAPPPPPAFPSPSQRVRPGLDLSNPLLESAWDGYARGGRYLTAEEATYIWQQIYRLADQNGEYYKLITVARHLDAQATSGKRCGVCAAIEGNHDDC